MDERHQFLEEIDKRIRKVEETLRGMNVLLPRSVVTPQKPSKTPTSVPSTSKSRSSATKKRRTPARKSPSPKRPKTRQSVKKSPLPTKLSECNTAKKMEELKIRWRRNKQRQCQRDAEYEEKTGRPRPRFSHLKTAGVTSESEADHESECSNKDSEIDPLLIETPAEPQSRPSGLGRNWIETVDIRSSDSSAAETVKNEAPSPEKLKTTKPTIIATKVYKIPRIRLNKCVRSTTKQSAVETTKPMITQHNDNTDNSPDGTCTMTTATEKSPRKEPTSIVQQEPETSKDSVE